MLRRAVVRRQSTADLPLDAKPQKVQPKGPTPTVCPRNSSHRPPPPVPCTFGLPPRRRLCGLACALSVPASERMEIVRRGCLAGLCAVDHILTRAAQFGFHAARLAVGRAHQHHFTSTTGIVDVLTDISDWGCEMSSHSGAHSNKRARIGPSCSVLFIAFGTRGAAPHSR